MVMLSLADLIIANLLCLFAWDLLHFLISAIRRYCNRFGVNNGELRPDID